MKRTMICTALTLSLVTLPLVSEARDNDRGHGNGYGGYSHDNGRGHGNYYRGQRNDYRGDHRGHGNYYGGYRSGRNDVLPWVLGAVAIGAVASIASGPTYYESTTYYDAPPPPPTRVYYSSPSYGYVTPPQTCTYYPDGSSYCR